MTAYLRQSAVSALLTIERIRMLSVAAAMLYLVWGRVFTLMDSSYVDPLWQRALVSGYLLLSFVSTFIKPVKKYAALIFLSAIWVITFHFFHLIQINELSLHYVAASFIIVMAVVYAFPNLRTAIAYGVFVTALSVFLFMEAKVPSRGLLLLVGNVTCLFIGLIYLLSYLKVSKAFSEAQSQASSVLHGLAVGITIRSIDGNVTSVNPSACKILGATREQLLGKFAITNTWKMIKESNKPFLPEEHPSSITLRTGKPVYNVIMGIEKANNEKIWVTINSVPMRDEEGNMTGTLVSFSDITSLKNAQQTVIDQQKVVANASKISSLGVMASGIAHEINNPLAVIHGRVRQIERLLQSSVDKADVSVVEKVRPLVENIQKMVDRIQKIVSGLKGFSRDGHGDPFVETKIKTVIEDAVSICREMLMRKEIELKVECALNLICECRAVHVSQALVNLIQNATDAVENLEEKWIKIEAVEEGHWVTISVEDSGKGIEPEVRERILEPFFTTKEVGKGTGLGLPISAGLIKDHGGDLIIDEHAKNTKFLIRLPKKHAIPQAA